jgi:hypothetical protein
MRRLKIGDIVTRRCGSAKYVQIGERCEVIEASATNSSIRIRVLRGNENVEFASRIWFDGDFFDLAPQRDEEL